MSMNIIPVGGAPTIQTPGPTVQPQSGMHDGVPFSSMLRDALQHVNETAAIAHQDSIDLALGEIDDIGQMNVNSARAGLAFEMLLQMRNRVLDAYQEMMRMSV